MKKFIKELQDFLELVDLQSFDFLSQGKSPEHDLTDTLSNHIALAIEDLEALIE